MKLALEDRVRSVPEGSDFDEKMYSTVRSDVQRASDAASRPSGQRTSSSSTRTSERRRPHDGVASWVPLPSLSQAMVTRNQTRAPSESW